MAAWMAAIMVIREFAVTGLRMVALEAGEVIAANRWGKAKMNAQSLAVFILLLGEPGAAGWRGVMAEIGWWAMLVAVPHPVLGVVLSEGHPAYTLHHLQARSAPLEPVTAQLPSDTRVGGLGHATEHVSAAP